MGWNSGYTIFEATVIGAYDLGKLDKKLLGVLMEPYRDSDIDSGGSEGLTTKDGKDVEEVVIKVWGLTLPEKPKEPWPKNEEAWDAYHEKRSELFGQVSKHFGWR